MRSKKNRTIGAVASMYGIPKGDPRYKEMEKTYEEMGKEEAPERRKARWVKIRAVCGTAYKASLWLAAVGGFLLALYQYVKNG